jgi:hypothetical protein
VDQEECKLMRHWDQWVYGFGGPMTNVNHHVTHLYV